MPTIALASAVGAARPHCGFEVAEHPGALGATTRHLHLGERGMTGCRETALLTIVRTWGSRPATAAIVKLVEPWQWIDRLEVVGAGLARARFAPRPGGRRRRPGRASTRWAGGRCWPASSPATRRSPRRRARRRASSGPGRGRCWPARRRRGRAAPGPSSGADRTADVDEVASEPIARGERDHLLALVVRRHPSPSAAGP